ncbi:hypothetical protein EDB81DRAFT_636186 [Dactylonectria macrodidyma]|uniref:Arrestin C-terminal-like domain-containing protein n=1 Tax=Dactylonectria macrodidyma TaxID=307937 RepID=A0A9P9FNW6_9HYPO|nr:hypothetical protein EDB81DRAFT_636186 [Dactylonectria macrodidyma]
MRSFLAKLTGASHPRVTIRPDKDVVFLSGFGQEARGDFIIGTVTLAVPDAHDVQGIQLEMIRSLAIGSHEPNEESGSWTRSRIISHQWDPLTLAASTVLSDPKQSHSPRIYRLPFDIYLPGQTSESVKGCSRCHISYRLQASLLRDGTAPDLRDFIPIYIIRKLPMSALELMDACTVGGTCSNNVEYQFSVAYQAIALNTFIPVEVALHNLSKGVRIGGIECVLYEIHRLEKQYSDIISEFEGERVAERWQLDVLETDGETYHLRQDLPLPSVFRKCSPDCNTEGIIIKHSLRFTVKLIDPDGSHYASVPITLFISPERPVNAWGRFVETDPTVAEGDADALSPGLSAPPRYYDSGEDLATTVLSQDSPPPYSP